MNLAELKPLLTALAMPPAAPLLLAGLGLLLRERWLGRALLLLALSSLWLVSCNASAVWLAHHIVPQVSALPAHAAAALQQQRVQAIVVLGGGVQAMAVEYGGPQASVDTAKRLRYGAWLARQSQLPLAFSGGVGWANSGTTVPSEAAVARELLAQDYGLSPRWLDGQSRDTAENALQMQRLLAPDGIRRIALVTHAWHMPRAQKAFERAGFTVTPAPTGFIETQQRSLLEWLPSARGLQASHDVLREWLGLRIAAY